MSRQELLNKLNALEQLKEEEKQTCKVYDTCNACPNLLAGGYCEIRLAISRLNYDLKKYYKEANDDIQNKICM